MLQLPEICYAHSLDSRLDIQAQLQFHIFMFLQFLVLERVHPRHSFKHLHDKTGAFRNNFELFSVKNISLFFLTQTGMCPSAAALIIKALKEPHRDRKKVKNIKHNGNITMDDIYNAARVIRPKYLGTNCARGGHDKGVLKYRCVVYYDIFQQFIYSLGRGNLA